MGFEYEAKTKLDDGQAKELIERLVAHRGWTVVERGARRVSFRFAGTPAPRPGEFDDEFAVELQPGGETYLRFHGATHAQEAEVKKVIAAAMKGLGVIGVKFEEL